MSFYSGAPGVPPLLHFVDYYSFKKIFSKQYIIEPKHHGREPHKRCKSY